MYHANHGLLPIYFYDISNNYVHLHNTRQSNSLHISLHIGHTMNIFGNTVNTRGPVLWNSLRANFKSISTVHVFKHQLFDRL